MVLTKEYRICMPLTVEEYQIGQLYMIARHSHEQTDSGEGVEVIENTACEDPEYGNGQYTEKRIHLSSRLPYWVQSLIPRVFYVTEKAWNYYPFTITEYTCSFIPKFNISIKTKYENNNGSTENCLNLTPEVLAERSIDEIDIAYDEVSPKHYKEEEDLRFFRSQKTGRGPLVEGWRDKTSPIMCSYKLVQVSFEVWGLQTRVEEMIQRSIREILLLGHRQAFAWIDEWHGMTLEDVRAYEGRMQKETNTKVTGGNTEPPSSPRPSTAGAPVDALTNITDTPAALPDTVTSSVTPADSVPDTPKTPRSWFSWS
ncbi:cytoplasmic phosphatidylinositol transfer protein 1 [Schistocerca nitens]|uniref:cytoplasmic phosphatidylinositol transfer protein 1 n=1 Tax=Schistocerca cancellata TaxID=274614 RepID=UPI0021186E35|nr:cytoplasmic phosphatidylinositol transfer protein 1 [Schistocerca cancellata]XP_049792499.1 cytoplasmic phosphatidylinositol transfer protein 1 [Schistocerca nitens]XP_049856206.1 cytoplasmic phosphatidylinositol transfer protein 1 [Schistocerca gregaria]